QLDVSHSLAPHPRQGHFHTATIANNAFVFYPLVFSAGTFPISCRTKNAFTEKSAFFRLERPVIDRFRVLNFALAPRAHGIARGHANRDLIKTNCALFTN